MFVVYNWETFYGGGARKDAAISILLHKKTDE